MRKFVAVKRFLALERKKNHFYCKSQIVPQDQVVSLIVVYCCLYLIKNKFILSGSPMNPNRVITARVL